MLKLLKRLFGIETEITDINTTVTKKNLSDYENRMKQLRKNYIVELCQDINELSKKGERFVNTENCNTEFISYKFLENELKPFFEERGFKVDMVRKYNGESYVHISW